MGYILYYKVNVDRIVSINSQSEIYIQNFEMLDIGCNNIEEILNILRDY